MQRSLARAGAFLTALVTAAVVAAQEPLVDPEFSPGPAEQGIDWGTVFWWAVLIVAAVAIIGWAMRGSRRRSTPV